jgi:dephospho-CoA kinase
MRRPKLSSKPGGRVNGSIVRRWPFLIIGLTGSIGMGKSTAANLLKVMNIPLFDSDRVVHALLTRTGAAFPFVVKRFPEALMGGSLDRATLGELVFFNSKARTDLENILYPYIILERTRFFRFHSINRSQMVVLDVPLLYEKGLDALCDYVFVVTAASFIQSQRVLARRGMTEDKYSAILKSQLPDSAKQFFASKVIFSGLGRHETCRLLAKSVSNFKKVK